MTQRRSRSRIAFAIALAVVVVGGVWSVFSEAHAGACRCPLIYAPVICDHDRTYSNQCLADCKNARNCVPAGIGAVE